MKKTLLFGFLAFGAAAFAANHSYHMTLAQDSVVEGKTLKAGDYKVTFDNGNAVIKSGKDSIEVPAREENDATKFQSTSLLYNENTLNEVRFGGTHMKLVFEGEAPTHAGQ